MGHHACSAALVRCSGRCPGVDVSGGGRAPPFNAGPRGGGRVAGPGVAAKDHAWREGSVACGGEGRVVRSIASRCPARARGAQGRHVDPLNRVLVPCIDVHVGRLLFGSQEERRVHGVVVVQRHCEVVKEVGRNRAFTAMVRSAALACLWRVRTEADEPELFGSRCQDWSMDGMMDAVRSPVGRTWIVVAYGAMRT